MKSICSVKSLPLTVLSGTALFFVLFVVFGPWFDSLRSLGSQSVSEAENTARLVLWEAQIRTVLNVAVVALQILGVTSFLLGTFVPGGRVARRSRFGFVIAMFGLGVVGSLCAWYGSEFALFSGGSMAVLLIGAILGSECSYSPTVSSLLNDPEYSQLAI